MAKTKPKRIGIDARFYGPQNKGLGRYVKEVVDGVTALDTDNEYVVFLRRDNFDDFVAPRPGVRKALADIRWYTLKEQAVLPYLLWRERLDLVHFPHFNVPLLYPGKFVVTIHDLILTRHPTQRASTLGPWLYKAKNLAYRLVIGSALRRARRVIAISRFTKDDIVSQFRTDPEKIAVVYEGVADSIMAGTAKDDKEILLGYNIHSPYLLYVGNAYPHKNLDALVDILPIIKEKLPELELVLVGKEDHFYRQLIAYARNSPVSRDIKFPGFVPDSDLGALYRQAACYVFPSLYEGFGLPPLEAMRHGCPVAAADNSCLPEVLGEAARYFNPLDKDDMVAQISRILDDQALRKALAEKGRRQSSVYRWADCAEKTIDIYGQ